MEQLNDWHFASDEDKSLGIETKIYENGQRMQRAKLSDGRVAVSRRLKGVDAREIRRLTGGEADKYQSAIIAKSVTINDQSIVMEDLDEMWLDDVSIITALASVNFPSAQNG